LYYKDWLRVGRQTGRSLIPGRVKNCLLFTSSRPTLGSIQPPPIRWVPGTLSSVVKRPRREAHLHLMPRSRKCGSIHPLPHTPSWRTQSVKHKATLPSPIFLFFGPKIIHTKSFILRDITQFSPVKVNGAISQKITPLHKHR
jgi:hypothetical protein